jgi:hypothetical protein
VESYWQQVWREFDRNYQTTIGELLALVWDFYLLYHEMSLSLVSRRAVGCLLLDFGLGVAHAQMSAKVVLALGVWSDFGRILAASQQY